MSNNLTELRRLREHALEPDELPFGEFMDFDDEQFYRAAHKHLPELLDEIERLRFEEDQIETRLKELSIANADLIEHLKFAEKVGVEAGLFGLEECGWYTGDET